MKSLKNGSSGLLAGGPKQTNDLIHQVACFNTAQDKLNETKLIKKPTDKKLMSVANGVHNIIVL